jgi:succinate dehydrogenase/fumarate reductase cytochrome b subunit
LSYSTQTFNGAPRSIFIVASILSVAARAIPVPIIVAIANRITGVILSLGAVGLVIWLGAAADGPRTYGLVQSAIGSWVGQIVLLIGS